MLHCDTLIKAHLHDSRKVFIMTVTLLSVLIAVIFITVACIKIHDGAARGFFMASVLLGVDITSLFLSFFVTRWISALVTPYIVSFLETLAVYRRFADLLLSLRTVLSAVLTMLIGSLFFIFVYLILRQLLKKLVLWSVKNTPFARNTIRDTRRAARTASEARSADFSPPWF